MGLKITNLITNPKLFFKDAKEKQNLRITSILFLIFSSLIFALWFIKVVLQINNIPVYSEETVFNTLFGSFDLSFILYLVLFLVVDIIILFIASWVLVALIKLICSLLKIEITWLKVWMISIYSSIAFVFQLLFNLLVYLINIEYLKYLGYLFYIYYLALIIIGIRSNK